MLLERVLQVYRSLHTYRKIQQQRRRRRRRWPKKKKKKKKPRIYKRERERATRSELKDATNLPRGNLERRKPAQLFLSLALSFA